MYINSLNLCNVHPNYKFKLTLYYMVIFTMYRIKMVPVMNGCSGIVLKLDYNFKDMLRICTSYNRTHRITGLQKLCAFHKNYAYMYVKQTICMHTHYRSIGIGRMTLSICFHIFMDTWTIESGYLQLVYYPMLLKMQLPAEDQHIDWSGHSKCVTT